MSTIPITFSTIWAVASGVGIGALGLAVLKRRDVRPRGWLAFGLFALAWSVQIVTINLPQSLASAGTAQLLYLVSAAAMLPLGYFLIEFTAAHARPGRSSRRWRALRLCTGGIAIAGAGVLAARPSLLLEGVSTGSAGGFFPRWGPAFDLIGISTKLAFAVAVVGLYTSVKGAPTSRTEGFSMLFSAGLGIYVAFNAANNLPFFLGSDLGLVTGAYTAVLGLAALVCAVLGGWSIQEALQAPTATERRTHLLLGLAYLVPLAWGGVEGVLASTVFPGLVTVGLWRLVAVAVMAYGLARWRSPILPGRVRHVGASATGSAGALATGATAFGVSNVATGGLVLPLVAGATVTGLTVRPAIRWTRELFGTDTDPNPVDQADQVYEQRIETYRAAVEDAMSRETLDEDEPFLESLRERFDIGDAEDRIVRYYARKATVPRREGDPDTAYERLRILGEGGAGRTWLARDRSRDRLVVLKEPLERWHEEPAVLEAARREARLAAKVRHPNVVEVEEVLEDDGRPVLVMEYVVGGSLGDKLREEGTLPPREAVRIGYDVACGLAAVHEAGLVHRDLKPDNVLLTEEDRALITDFGLARPQNGSGTRLLDEGAGSKGYRAPEAACGSDEPAVDVYGCAALLHTSLYGSPPAPGTVQVDADVPDELRAILERGLAQDPDDRFEDARALADGLEELVEP